MIFDPVETDLSHHHFPSQFSRTFHHKMHAEVEIQPWNEQKKQEDRTFSQKQERKLQTKFEVKSRRKSVDERIEQMYRKYSKQGINIGQYVDNLPLNSRQMYRQKLNWLQKGQEFKKIGKNKIIQDPQKQLFPQKPKQKAKIPHFFCIDNKVVNRNKWQSPKKNLGYKGIQNFQRMLKIKEKMRKKHTLSVHKQKQEYNTQVRNNLPLSQRQTSFQNSTKATLERNKLKIKMRGVSKEALGHAGQAKSKMEVRGTCSNAYEYVACQEGFDLANYPYWQTQQSSRPSLSTFLSRSRQMSR